MQVRDLQSEIISALSILLSGVAEVEEGDVRAIFDSDDDSRPDEFIILQPGTTSEVQSVAPRMPNSVQEQMVVSIVLVSKKRQYAPGLRALRLAVKIATGGPKCGLAGVAGVASAGFQQETPTLPGEGRRWAARVMPLQVSYTQPLK